MTPSNQILLSLLFLAANVLSLLFIQSRVRRKGSGETSEGTEEALKPLDPAGGDPEGLASGEILGMEFGYAQTTASEAMQDRHTMINFYLLAVGVVISGVIGVLGSDNRLPGSAGTLLLWLLCGIGWLYMLKIVTLRKAWYESAQAMNQIKDFYTRHAREFDRETLREAFRWKSETLPPPDKPWTVFFFSAMLIALLNSAMYIAGGALISLDNLSTAPGMIGGTLALLGAGFFAFHVWMYFALFR